MAFAGSWPSSCGRGEPRQCAVGRETRVARRGPRNVWRAAGRGSRCVWRSARPGLTGGFGMRIPLHEGFPFRQGLLDGCAWAEDERIQEMTAKLWLMESRGTNGKLQV